MGFEKVYVTKQGLQLEAKARTGKILTIVRVEIGDGQLTNDNITEQTTIINKKLSCNINSIKNINNQTILNFILQQSNIEEGFYFREFGVIAKDPDTQQELLYMYANAGNKAEYINDKTSNSISDKIIDIIVKEDNTDNITISINNTGVYVDREEYQAKIQQLNEALSTKSDKPTSYSLTIPVEAWIQNEETQVYEYNVVDSNITKDHSVDGKLHLNSQGKLGSSVIKSYNGGYKVKATELPTESVTMDIVIMLTNPVSTGGEEV